MKKVFLLATAFLFVTGVAMADKGKKKKCCKGKTSCSKDSKTTKSESKEKAKSTTASM